MKTTQRPAIAMIELIFAIVVMGIVLMSGPTLIGVATKSGDSGSMASFQESTTEVAALVKLITTRNWDNNDTNNSAPILHTNIAPLIVAASFPGRVSRKRVDDHGNALLMTPIGAEGDGLLNDMDDFNGVSTSMTLGVNGQDATQGVTDYIDFDVNLTSQVRYGKAGTPGDEPFSGALGGINDFNNTKLITVTLTSPHFPDKNISLSTFSCNIGSYRIRELGTNL